MNAADTLRHRGTYTAELSSVVRGGQGGLKHVPGLLKHVLRDDSWTEFITVRGVLVRHDTFQEFVQDPPLRGLGADLAMLERMCAHDPEAASLLDAVLQRPSGRPRTVNNINGSRPVGTSQAQALRRLRDHDPDLHTRVLAGELSPHAAMVEAGFRPRTISVRVADPDSVARTLRRHMTADDRARLAELLKAVE